MTTEPNNMDRLDEATAERLATLADIPVDTTRLETRLNAAIDSEDSAPRPLVLAHWWRPVTSIAAAVMVVCLVGWAVIGSGQPAVAAPFDLARLHWEVTDDDSATVPVSTIDEANQRIAAEWATAPTIPAPVDAAVKSCCLHLVKSTKVVCVSLDYEGRAVTLVVAHGKDLCSADGQIITRGQKQFMGHEMNGLMMVMTEHEGRWLCVMGQVPIERLADLAEGIEF